MKNSNQPSANQPINQSTKLPYDNFFRQPIAEGSIAPDFEPDKVIMNCDDILKLDGSQRRYLLHPLLPVTGTAVMAGQPDSGKTQFTRQMALCIALGVEEFLGFKLHAKHKRVLIVCTEDDAVNTSYLIKQQLKGISPPTPQREDKAVAHPNPKAGAVKSPSLGGVGEAPDLHYIFSDCLGQYEVLLAVDNFLSKSPCDLVVFDAWADLFLGSDSNSNQAARQNVRNFNYFAGKHKCLFFFVHHTTKSSYKSAPNQAHILGAGGIVQKCRFAGMLNMGKDKIRYFTVVKANYTPHEYKQKSMELFFDEKHFLFTPTGKEIDIDLLDTEENKPNNMEKLQTLAEEIFDNESISYKEFCTRHQQITGRALASATRDDKTMKQLEIIFRDGKKWSINH